MLLPALSSMAVLKEQDLARTLSVLRLELERSYKQQKSFMARYEIVSKEQHEELVDYMKRSEQISLILYSQKTDFTLDVAYACQQATDLYKALHKTNVPYGEIREKMLVEIARYDSLIASLKQLPPAIEGKQMFDAVLDSLSSQIDSLSVKTDSLHENEPYILNEAEQKDRETCLFYAKALRNNLIRFLNSITRDNVYRKRVSDQVERLNTYALQRYETLQKSIFVNAGQNYLAILLRLPLYINMVKRDFTDKYLPLSDGNVKSEWRGTIVLSVSIFMLFYILVATLLSNLIMRGIPWVMKRVASRFSRRVTANIARHFIDREEYRYKRRTITLAVGVALFAIAIMVIKNFLYRNLFLMAADLMINLAWLMEAILVSLIIRLKGRQMRAGMAFYMPFIVMAFIVILFRIILIPNSIVNLIYPPILLLFVIWQMTVQRKYRDRLPLSDSLYSTISLFAMIVGCVLSWVGYTLLAVQIMIWWTFQLAAIQTITCMYDILKMYERRILISKVQGLTGSEAASDELLVKQMKKGTYFTTTWMFDLVNMTLIPVLGVLSVLLSIYLSASIFEMNSFVERIFFYNFIDKANVLQISLYKLCIVIACYFIFRYLNYAIRSYYSHWYTKAKSDTGNYNETLVKNVIAILVWGCYFWFGLILLQVPKSGISIVTAGLATGMGFAMKDLLENFFYGISLMTGRLKVGDWIECDGIQGKVESITYQSTQIITIDGSVMAFLNSALFNKNFKNQTRNHSYVLQIIPFGVAYGSDVAEVRNLVIEAMQPLCKADANGEYMVDPRQPLSVRVAEFGESSIDLKLYVWVLVHRKGEFLGACREAIYNTLNANHIEIPFPQRDINIRQIPNVENLSSLLSKNSL